MSDPTRLPQPIILIRGFGGLNSADEKKDAYQRFNIGTVYPHKKGENYIYEGMLLRLMKSAWQYQDATNVIGYYGKVHDYPSKLPPRLEYSDDSQLKEKFRRWQQQGYFSGDKVIVDPDMALNFLSTVSNPWRTLWVFRYYDLDERDFTTYGQKLLRAIDLIRELTEKPGEGKPKVNIIAHSMGGLLVREVVQQTYPHTGRRAEDDINKIVTLGTPHQGITFQVFRKWLDFIDAGKELERFYPENPGDSADNPLASVNFHKFFPSQRLLTLVGTNYHNRNDFVSALNRLFPREGEFGPNYNRSDGLVKQSAAQIPGSPRTFVHKTHGGTDSLISSRESYEITTRFFFGNIVTRLRLIEGKINRGKDFFGKSEFFFGICVKPRGVDFELFHQSKVAENCYGPFSEVDPQDKNVNFRERNSELSFPWADENKLIWQGYLDTDQSLRSPDLVIRLEFYVSERDLLGFGFSDNIVFHEQYYVRALLPTPEHPEPLLYLHSDESFADPNFQYAATDRPMPKVNGAWQFIVGDEQMGFMGTFSIEIEQILEVGQSVSMMRGFSSY